MKGNKTELFVPGRLCLFGEHSDWAGRYRTMNADILPGRAIVTGIEQGIYATVEASSILEIYSTAPEMKDIWEDFRSPMESQALDGIARSSSFFSYCAGVAAHMVEHFPVGGLKIEISSMTLPIKRGLSSSAAICVLIARAFNRIYELGLSTEDEMDIAYSGELRTASQCGRLDQACAFGGSTMLMDFDGNDMHVHRLSMKTALHWVFADLNASKDTIRILKDLNKAFPFADDKMESDAQEALGKVNLDITARAVEYMRSGDKEALGKLMNEAQAVFDSMIAPMCPEELTAPVLHSVLNDPELLPLVFGGKGVGSQGDGSVQFLAKDKESQDKLIGLLAKRGMKAYPLTIQPAHEVRKAIIPVAGFGTRLYPETRMVKKDFFPVVDRDGMVKPAILILLEELVESGVEKICIILGSEAEREDYREFFEKRLPEEHLSKLSKRAQEYEDHILEIGKRLEFAYQRERRGFGHAVYQAAGFAGNEPVLLLLGDTIYRSRTSKRCTLQLIEEYEGRSLPMISIHETALEDVSYYGIITGRWTGPEEKTMMMTRMVEKPSSAYAEEHLGVPGKDGKDRYWSVFGQYILTAEVFEQLGKDIGQAGRSSCEIELTSALEKVRSTYGMTAVRIDGEMFDLGNPRAYKEAITKFSE